MSTLAEDVASATSTDWDNVPASVKTALIARLADSIDRGNRRVSDLLWTTTGMTLPQAPSPVPVGMFDNGDTGSLAAVK